MVRREGIRKRGHVRIRQLWVGEKDGAGELRYRKVNGIENMTKALTSLEIKKYIEKIHLQGKGGRPERSLEAQLSGPTSQCPSRIIWLIVSS